MQTQNSDASQKAEVKTVEKYISEVEEKGSFEAIQLLARMKKRILRRVGRNTMQGTLVSPILFSVTCVPEMSRHITVERDTKNSSNSLKACGKRLRTR